MCWDPASWAGDRCDRAPSCTNGERDGLETDVDWYVRDGTGVHVPRPPIHTPLHTLLHSGGAACPVCAGGMACASQADCASGQCQGGVCTDPHAACVAAATTVSAAQLGAAMGDAGGVRADEWALHAPALNAALASAGMDCPARAAGLLAQSRAATTDLTALTTSSGAVGLLPLALATIRSACGSSASVAAAMASAGVASCAAASDASVAAAASSPDAGWTLGTWYFVHGAREVRSGVLLDAVGVGVGCRVVTLVCVFGGLDAGRGRAVW